MLSTVVVMLLSLSLYAHEIVPIRDTFITNCHRPAVKKDCVSCLHSKGIPELDASLKALVDSGKAVDFAEQMAWAREAASIAKKKLLKQYPYFDEFIKHVNGQKVKEADIYEKRISKLKDLIFQVAGINRELSALEIRRKNFESFFAVCPVFDDKCREKVNKTRNAFIDDKDRLEILSSILYDQEPFLVDSDMSQCISNMTVNPFPVTDKKFCFGKFDERLKKATLSAQKTIAKGIINYSDVLNNEASLMSMLLGLNWSLDEGALEAYEIERVADNVDSVWGGIKNMLNKVIKSEEKVNGRLLMAELVLTTDKETSPILQKLDRADCLAQQNIIAWDMNKLANQLARDQAIVMASLGGSLLFNVSKGAALFTSTTGRVVNNTEKINYIGRIIAAGEITTNIPNFLDIREHMMKCEIIKRQALIDDGKNYEGKAVSRSYQDCLDEAHLMTTMSILAAVGSGVAVKSILGDAAASAKQVSQLNEVLTAEKTAKDLVQDILKRKTQKPQILTSIKPNSKRMKRELKKMFEDILKDFPGQEDTIERLLGKLRKRGLDENEIKDIFKKVKCSCTGEKCTL